MLHSKVHRDGTDEPDAVCTAGWFLVSGTACDHTGRSQHRGTLDVGESRERANLGGSASLGLWKGPSVSPDPRRALCSPRGLEGAEAGPHTFENASFGPSWTDVVLEKRRPARLRGARDRQAVDSLSLCTPWGCADVVQCQLTRTAWRDVEATTTHTSRGRAPEERSGETPCSRLQVTRADVTKWHWRCQIPCAGE